MNSKYQLVVMGPEAGAQFPAIQSQLQDQYGKLGLDTTQYPQLITSGMAKDVDPRSVVAGAWFGSAKDVTEPPILMHLISSKIPVLPLVDDAEGFGSKVPPALFPINGRTWSDSRVPGDLLRLLHLTRRQRQAFISYRRVDSGPIARQLFEAMTGRSYQTFLDTASVDAAENFQDTLWSRMADIDLIILLDSPTGLGSRWVREELVQAQHLGLGVLRLTWPKPDDSNKPTPGTEFCIGYDLKKHHFEKGNTGADGTLTATTIAEVLTKVEQVRIESLALRRRRISSELADRAAKHKLRIDFQPVGPVTITTSANGAPIAVAIPLIGLPDAWAVHEQESHAGEVTKDAKALNELVGGRDVRVLFDGLGLDERWSLHLEWLNTHLKLQTVGFDRRKAGRPDPLDQWLADLARRYP